MSVIIYACTIFAHEWTLIRSLNIDQETKEKEKEKEQKCGPYVQGATPAPVVQVEPDNGQYVTWMKQRVTDVLQS